MEGAMEEHKYYPLVKEALEREFRNHGYRVDFEVTGYPKGKRIPNSKKLVVAEFKHSPRFTDIFQTKGYDELFRADYTILLSAKSISKTSEITMNLLRIDPQLLKTKGGKGKIYIMFVHKTAEGTLTLARLASEVGHLPDLGADLAS